MSLADRLDSDLRILKTVFRCMHKDENSYYLTSRFLDGHFQLAHHLTQTRDQSLQITHEATSNINQDIWNICSLISRMEWFRALASQSDWTNNHPFLWSLYSSLDIECFYVECRSILDYIAIALGGLSGRPKEVPSSFERLYNRLEKGSINEEKLGVEASSIVRSASWYADLRQIRDNIVHYGSNAFVFGSPKDGILFQVYRGWKKSVIIEPLMWNENVADFRLYAALYFSRILTLVEQLGELILTRTPDQVGISNVTANYSGIDILAEWIDLLMKKMGQLNTR